MHAEVARVSVRPVDLVHLERPRAPRAPRATNALWRAILATA